MKILHFGKYYPPFHGGMEVYLRDLVKQQSAQHQVVVLAHNHEFGLLYSDTKEEYVDGIKVIRQSTLKPVLFTPFMLGVRKKVRQLVEEFQPDVIHISWPNPSALLLLLSKEARRIPWVVQWQSDMVTDRSSRLLKIAYWLFRPFEKKLLKQASSVIASTKEYFSKSKALKPFEYKCSFIPLGIEFASHEVSQDDHNWAESLWGDSEYKIYNIGRLTFYKNHELLINAAKEMPEARFVITGSGKLESQLKQQIKNARLSNVVLTGSLSSSKLHALLQSCDIFCLPSNDRAESYGMVLLEALDYGKPILVSNLPGSGMKWIASQTHLGTLFDCNSAKDLVQKIRSIALNSVPDSNIHKIFSMESCAESINALYHSMK